MQAEIYRQLLLLIPDQVAHYDSFKSRVSGSPLLRMDILERHAYTQFLRLTYHFENSEEKEGHCEISPDAHIRLYRDARLAEVTSFNPQQGCTRLAHPAFPQQQLFQRSWRQNLALDKWLGYLIHQGHNVITMRPANNMISNNQSQSVIATMASKSV